LKVEKIGLPHPFMITAKHVSLAAVEFAGLLGKAALAEADKRGIKCGWNGCQLSYTEHETPGIIREQEQTPEPPPLELCIRCGGMLDGKGFQVRWLPHYGSALLCQLCGLDLGY
jgi:hypothetical protein